MKYGRVTRHSIIIFSVRRFRIIPVFIESSKSMGIGASRVGAKRVLLAPLRSNLVALVIIGLTIIILVKYHKSYNFKIMKHLSKKLKLFWS